MTGVGIIMSRFFGVDYLLGVFLGLAGVVLCSFLGGMKSITWTQVAQYIILIIAYLIPVSWLALRFTGFPIAELMYGQALQAIDVAGDRRRASRRRTSSPSPRRCRTPRRERRCRSSA